jgi:taurine dioxygenase
MACETISVTPMTPHIGGLVGGIDLTQPLSPETVRDLHDALMEYQVLFFRDQRLTHETQKALGEHFGRLHISVGGDGTNSKQLSDHPEVRALHFDETSTSVSGNEMWHTDQSCMVTPPMGSVLYMTTVPPDGGGDTMFASMYAAYDALSEPMKRFLDGMTAMHDGAPYYRSVNVRIGRDDKGRDYPHAEHPIVRTHPVSGRKALFVNSMFTTHIVGLPKKESDAILDFLFDHIAQPRFQCRFRWQKNSMAFWDNRCVQHQAIWDYWPQTRSGYRVTIKGERPV